MNSNNDYDHNLKILLIGNSGVGKSCILTRFSQDKFTQNFLNTIGVDFKVKYIDVNGQKCKLVLWDTAGQQRFRTITNSYYRGANGIIIVYDITDHQSFQNISHWYNQMNNNVNQKVACMIVGNKVDMGSKRAVTYQQGKSLAEKYGIQFMQTSAKTAQNINQLFKDITQQMIKINQGAPTKTKRLKPPLVPRTKDQTYCTCCN